MRPSLSASRMCWRPQTKSPHVLALFEFVTILLSIVVGLAMTQILVGIANSIRDPDVVRPYLVHSMLAVALLVVLIQQWWEAWSLRGRSEWSFFDLLVMLMPTIGGFLVAHVLFPRAGAPCDLREYYYARRRLIYGLIVVVTASAAARSMLFSGDLLVPANLQTAAVFVAAAVLAIVRSPAVHGILVAATLIATLADIAVTALVFRE